MRKCLNFDYEGTILQNIFGKKTILVHKKLQGKIEIKPRVTVKNKADLSVYNTPGVGAASFYVAEHKDKMLDYTMKGSTVAGYIRWLGSSRTGKYWSRGGASCDGRESDVVHERWNSFLKKLFFRIFRLGRKKKI